MNGPMAQRSIVSVHGNLRKKGKEKKQTRKDSWLLLSFPVALPD